MATHKSAVKANRQSLIKRDRNRSHRTRLRTQLKKLRLAVDGGDAKLASELLKPTLSLLDHSVHLGIIHRNAASRTTSRLTRHVNRVSAAT
jgi:small subunit ribosomal protein S20